MYESHRFVPELIVISLHAIYLFIYDVCMLKVRGCVDAIAGHLVYVKLDRVAWM